MAGAEEFWLLIDDLMNQHITLTTDLIKEADKLELQRVEFLRESYTQIDDMIYKSAPDVNKFTQQFYDIGKKEAVDSMKVEAFTGAADTNALYHLSNYNMDLIKNMNMDMRMEIRQRVWQGVARDQSPAQIARRIEKLPIEPIKAGNRTLSPKYRAKMIAHTESVRARVQGQLVSFKQYGVEYKEVLNRPSACGLCKLRRADNPYKIDDSNGDPPFHPYCRCSLIAASPPMDTPIDPSSYTDLVTKETVNVNPDLVFTI